WQIMKAKRLFALCVLLTSARALLAEQPRLGLFSSEGNVGTVGQPGSVLFDAAKGTYLIAGSGDNMWSTNDAFRYVWKEMSGDVSLSADIKWLGTSGQPH